MLLLPLPYTTVWPHAPPVITSRLRRRTRCTGLVYQANGQTEEALGKFRLAVEDYPLSYYAYLSLVELLNASAGVSDLDRGLVRFFPANMMLPLLHLPDTTPPPRFKMGPPITFWHSPIATSAITTPRSPPTKLSLPTTLQIPVGAMRGAKRHSSEWYNNGAFSIAAELFWILFNRCRIPISLLNI